MVAAKLSEDVQVLAHRIGRALEPGLHGRRLLGGEDLNVAPGERVETVGPPDVAVERHRVELGQHVHPLHARVDGVGDRDVDQSVLAGDRDRRFAAAHRQGRQPRCRARRRGSVPSRRDCTLRERSSAPPWSILRASVAGPGWAEKLERYAGRQITFRREAQPPQAAATRRIRKLSAPRAASSGPENATSATGRRRGTASPDDAAGGAARPPGEAG